MSQDFIKSAKRLDKMARGLLEFMEKNPEAYDQKQVDGLTALTYDLPRVVNALQGSDS